ncbi:MAG TPA: DMT family transporter [Acidimicrobiales bacterium]|nr:DMT family transporter [Acidimicrobiales bacterium]
MIIAIALAVLTAATNAASNVLQRKANMQEPPEVSFSLRMIGDLLRRKVWLAGFAAVLVSFLLQAAALHFGTLAAVQPVVILELPLTLVGAMVALHAPIGQREWLAAGLLTVGVVALVGGLHPTGGSPRIATGAWLLGLAVAGAAVAALVVAGVRHHGDLRGAFLGGATGIAFAVTAALMAGATDALTRGGITGLFTSWTTYAMAAAGCGAMFLTQNALQAGRLVAAQPGITLLDPIASVLWGTVLFHERTGGSALLAVAVAGLACMVVGAVELSRSDALADEPGREPAATE